ncbi:MAG: MBL fold metallo-hydrolase [Eubacteriaceae bacterium]|jgi:phosphoribosyl 1,2-cyclic phosphodiesterase|nr:MBL fold metallo-hydrolase [Eubacteriaceae bacterium]
MSELRLISLSSGSTGNCLYIEGGGAKILVDCGVTLKRASEGLKSLGVTPKDVDALLLTHEHSDHVKGAGYAAKYFGLQIYGNEATLEKAAPAIKKTGPAKGCFAAFENGAPFSVKGLVIRPFATSHDAADPVGFVVSDGHSSIGVMSDTGCVTEGAAKALAGCPCAYIEANHDVEMLKSGPYPYSLKRRILSASGHLSNADSGEFIASLIRLGLKKVLLGHLSLENNRPLLAYETVEAVASSHGMRRRVDYILGVAPHYEASSPLSAN